jgi:HSP20 family protein
MPLRRDPLQDLLDLQERMNRLFEQTLGREQLEEPPFLSGSWVPLADVYETAEAYVVELELAGITRGDVEVQIRGDELVVRGERRRPPGGRPDVFHRLERRNGPFARTFRFPEEVNGDRVSAEFRDGLLRLDVPKAQAHPGGHVVRVERPE